MRCSVAAIRWGSLGLLIALASAWVAGSVAVVAAQTPAPGTGVAADAPGVAWAVLATTRLDAAPVDRHWVLRRGHPLNEDAHAHSGGFVYAARGASYLVVEDGQGVLLQEGEAAWAPERIGHLHATPARASSAERAAATADIEVWAILLERGTDARRPGAAVISPLLHGLLPGPYEARLSLLTVQPGMATPMRQVTGPQLAYTLDGSWELEYAGVPFVFGAGQGYLADPGVPHRLRNTSTLPGWVLAAQLVPLGQPAETQVPEAQPQP